MFGQANVLAGLKAKLPRRQSSSSESSVSDVRDAKSDILPSSKNVSSIVPHSVDKDHSDMAWGQDSISSQPRYISLSVYHYAPIQSAWKHNIFVLMFDTFVVVVWSTAKVLAEDCLPQLCHLIKMV